MSASLVNDVGSTIVIGDEPRRKLPSAARNTSIKEGRFVSVISEEKIKADPLLVLAQIMEQDGEKDCCTYRGRYDGNLGRLRQIVPGCLRKLLRRGRNSPCLRLS